MKINRYEAYPIIADKAVKKVGIIDKSIEIKKDVNLNISTSKNMIILKEGENLKEEIKKINKLIENNLENINIFRSGIDTNIDKLIEIQIKFRKNLDSKKPVFLKIKSMVEYNLKKLLSIKAQVYKDGDTLINTINKEINEYIEDLQGMHKENTIFLERLQIAILDLRKNNPYMNIEKIKRMIVNYNKNNKEIAYRKDIGPEENFNKFIMKNKNFFIIIIFMLLFTILIIKNR